MCAIFGFSSMDKEPHWAVREIMAGMFQTAVRYGKDATGWMMYNDRYVSDKKAISGDKYYFEYGLPNWRDNFIAHVRLATSGSPKDNKNNHPFEGDIYGMVHNGYIYGWDYYYRMYFYDEIESECDSEIFLRNAEDFGFGDMYREWQYEAVFSLVFLKKDDGVIYLMRNPLQRIYYVDMTKTILRTFFIVSRKDIFDNMVRYTFKKFPGYKIEPFKSGTIYKIVGGKIEKEMKIKGAVNYIPKNNIICKY